MLLQRKVQCVSHVVKRPTGFAVGSVEYSESPPMVMVREAGINSNDSLLWEVPQTVWDDAPFVLF